MTPQQQPPLVVHLIHRLAVGGLENGLINLINTLPVDRYRHAIVCMDDFTDFRRRIRRPDVQVHALHKRPGQDWGLYLRLWRLLRRLRPAIVHTRNLGTLEGQWVAWAAGVRLRVHGEHGWDVAGPGGSSPRHRMLRRLLRPWVSHYIALGEEIRRYLIEQIGVPEGKVSLIYNGVDGGRFHPRRDRSILPEGFAGPDSLVLGTVGRMQAVKDQPTLVRAFIHLLTRQPDLGRRLRLMLVGDGPLRGQVEALVVQAGLESRVWLAGERQDIPDCLAALDLFVLPSLAEGISNTILEAMASGLPTVATRVGANGDLLEEGRTGYLVPAADPEAMADALAAYVSHPERLSRHGQAARQRVERMFNLETMVADYSAVYDALLEGRTPSPQLLRT